MNYDLNTANMQGKAESRGYDLDINITNQVIQGEDVKSVKHLSLTPVSGGITH